MTQRQATPAAASVLAPVVLGPDNWQWAPVDPVVSPDVTDPPSPDLGALSDFVGTWTGTGFNTIFRPNTSTPPGGDNVLELNLTAETLSFASSLGAVPNRGTLQGDVFLNGLPYQQTVSDVTGPGKSVGIHVEPGLWMMVPATTQPAVPQSYARMASIPHGTTIVAQGFATTTAGKPTIPSVDITPSVLGGGPKVPFPSQTAANVSPARLPQDLTA